MSANSSDRCNFVTSLISSLSTVTPPDPPNRMAFTTLLLQLSEADTKHAKSLMLTLHFLFPHELLPALDLLDRGLVNCFRRSAPSALDAQGDGSNALDNASQTYPETFYVQSASAVTSKSNRSAKFRKTFNPSDIYYEVHLDSWNCSCPAFAYSAFGGFDHDAEPLTNKANEDKDEDDIEQRSIGGWVFGGSLAVETVSTPICKHILAAAISKGAPELFREGFDTRMVSVVEMAGWAAGWGE